MSEFELIERFFMRDQTGGATRPDIILGIGDDAALLQVPQGSELAVSVDTLVAGRHFPLDSDAYSIGYRALAVNLSDMAAMGATPAWATLALTMPAADAGWLESFSNGFMSLARAHGVVLVGGDTTAGPLCLTVQIMGHVVQGTALRRGGGRPGDLLAVTGTLGDAAGGLAIMQDRIACNRPAAVTELRERFSRPVPRVAFGARARGLASAAMDLSDGLAGDLPKLAAASGGAAHVDVGRLPLSQALRASGSLEQARRWALSGGDDYELLLAIPPPRFPVLAAVAAELNLTLTAIGELRRGSGVTWSLDGEPFVNLGEGYDHFR